MDLSGLMVQLTAFVFGPSPPLRSCSRLLNYTLYDTGTGTGSRYHKPTCTHTIASTRVFISKLRFEFKTGSVIDCVLPVVFPAFCDSVDRTFNYYANGWLDCLLIALLLTGQSNIENTIHFNALTINAQRVRF